MAIEDPKQRIKYIRSMAELAASSNCGSFANAFANIRKDVGLIQSPKVREKAYELLQQAAENAYILERNPTQYTEAISRALDSLAAFLEANDK